MKHMFSNLAVLLMATGWACAAQANQPYAGFATREVKALSDQQIADLKAGRGAGFALAAELNGYPGPSHVLELEDALSLSPEQRRATQELFDAMKAEAAPLGERLVTQEAELDRLFATKAADAASVDGKTRAIAETQGRLRAVHLKYHLAMMDILAADQVGLYSRLRGYSGSGAPAHGGSPHRH